jgi:hypothetical protein
MVVLGLDEDVDADDTVDPSCPPPPPPPPPFFVEDEELFFWRLLLKPGSP